VGLGMDSFERALEAHPSGEVEKGDLDGLAVDTHGRRIHVEWDPASPVTPLGQLVFFSQFLATAGLFSHWVERCPLRFSSPNAPTLTNLLGTITLSVLAGQFRYAHITGLRADTVNPVGLGMSKVCSEDSVRRAFAGADAEACARWQIEALTKTVSDGLKTNETCRFEIQLPRKLDESSMRYRPCHRRRGS